MNKIGRKTQKVFWLLAIFTALIYLFHFAVHAQKNPLRLDEVDYYQCMENIIRLGLPIYYAGEIKIEHSRLIYLYTRHLDGKEFIFWRFKPETGILKETFFALVNDASRYTFGMWHPPLYIYLGSLMFRLLSITPEHSHFLRYFNLVFSIGVFTGMLILSRELYPTIYRRVFLIAALLYALNSLAVRGSTLLDYNATLGPFAALWFVAASLRAERAKSPSWELVGATAWVLFTGLGIAVSLFLSISIYCLLRLVLGVRRNLGQIILSTILGIIIFLASFWVFCKILQLPFSQPFLHNVARFQTSPGTLHSPQRLLTTLWTYLWWYIKEIGVLPAITWICLSLRSIFEGLKPVYRRFLLPITIATGLISHASLGANAYWFPKYILFVLPLLFVFIGGEAALLISHNSGLKKAVRKGFVVILVLNSMFISFHWISHPGSTLYSPGETGLLPIARTLRIATSPDEIVLGRKDIGFFARRRFIEWSGRLLSDVTLLQGRIYEAHIRYAVSPIFLLDPSTDIGAYLQKEFVLENTIGDFALLHRRER
ncbi:MAG: hypothetical protein H5T61_10245 [Thermoflexales bacterium]|nr:hypothetical protein [Thermoflexales bacterium]